MTSDPDDPEDSPGLAALTELGRDAVEPHTRAELDAGFRALRRRVAAARARRRALAAATMLGAAAACVALALQVAGVRGRHAPAPEPPLVVTRIEGGDLLEGGYLSKSGRAGVTVIFSEGSTFALMPGARGRLRSVDADGARLALEHGTAAFRVTPNRERRWLVEAGPFLVTVKGTVFTVSWDPASERFELVLQHGRVVVSGPAGDIALRAGQHLVVSLPQAETVITAEPPASAPGAGPEVPPPAVTVSLGPPSTPRATVARPAASGPPHPRRPRRSAAVAAGPPSSSVDPGTASSPTSTATASTRRSKTRPAPISSRSPTRPDIDGAPTWPARRCWRSGVAFPAPRARSTRSSCSGAWRNCARRARRRRSPGTTSTWPRRPPAPTRRRRWDGR